MGSMMVWRIMTAVVCFVGHSGRPLTMEEAEERIFGLVLMNDWSARYRLPPTTHHMRQRQHQQGSFLTDHAPPLLLLLLVVHDA